MSGVTTYIIALRKQAAEFVRFCHAHACDLVELSNGASDGGVERGMAGSGRVHAFCVVERDFDATILPEAIFGRWPYPFDSEQTLRDLLEDLVEDQLNPGGEVSILLLATSPEELRESPVLQGVLTLLEEKPRLQRRAWLAAAFTCSPQVEVPAELFRGSTNPQGMLDSAFFLSPAKQRGSGVLSELHWPGLRMLIDLTRDDGEARSYFLGANCTGSFWVPPDRVQCGAERRPEALAAFLNRAVHAMKVFDRGRSQRESEELKRFHDRLDEFERQLREFEIPPSEGKSLDLGKPQRPRSFLLEHVGEAFENFASKARQSMEQFREKRLHRDFLERSDEVEDRRRAILDRYFRKEPLTMPFADMPLDKETDEQLREREERLRRQAQELQEKARALRLQASLETDEPRAEHMRDRVRKLQLAREYRRLEQELIRAGEQARRIFPVFTTERVIGILGLLLVLSMVLVHDYNTSLVSLGDEGLAMLRGLADHFGVWALLPAALVAVALLASLAWGVWRWLFGEKRAFLRLSGLVEGRAGKVEEAFQRLSETAASYLFHSGGALMARHMYERLHAQRTGNVFRLLEEQARRLWRTPGQSEIAEQARDRSIVEAFTLSLQQAARWECQENGSGRLALAVGHTRTRIARNAMFYLIRQWLERHEARPWQINITGDANVAIVREWREAIRSAPLDIAGTYGLQRTDSAPCQGLIVPLAPFAPTRKKRDIGANGQPPTDTGHAKEEIRELPGGDARGMEEEGAGHRGQISEDGSGAGQEGET